MDAQNITAMRPPASKQTESATPDASMSAPVYTVGKPFWQSKTMVGVAVALISLVVGLHGGHVNQAALTDDITTGIGILGTLLAFYGRIKADQPIVFAAPAVRVEKALPVDQKQSGSVRLMLLLSVAALLGSLFTVLSACSHSPDAVVPIRDPETPVVHHASVSYAPPFSALNLKLSPAALDLLSSLRVSPDLEIMTNSAGHSIPVVSATVTGAVEF